MIGILICAVCLQFNGLMQSVSWLLYLTPICWQAFQESMCQCLQKYCLNYSAALLYLDNLKPREDFGIYVKVQEGNRWERLNCVRESSLWQGRHVPWQCGRQPQTNKQLSVAGSCQREECDHFSHIVAFPVIILMYLSGHSVCFCLFHHPSPITPLF